MLPRSSAVSPTERRNRGPENVSPGDVRLGNVSHGDVENAFLLLPRTEATPEARLRAKDEQKEDETKK